MIPKKKEAISIYFICISVYIILSAVTIHAGVAKGNFYDFSAKVKYDFINFYQDNLSRDSLQWNELSVYPKLQLMNKNAGFTAEGFLRKNFNYEGRSLYTMKETYANLSLEHIELKLGKQIINWGVADEIKPTDYFKRYDYTDILRKEEEGIFAFRATYQLGRANIDFVWAPVFDTDRISYDHKNPWAVVPRQEISFTLNNEHKPAMNLEASQFGLRAGFEQSGIDYSFTYIYGIDRLPTFIDTQTVGIVEGKPLVEVIPFHERIHLFGADWNKSFSTWNFKGEAAYVITEHPEISPYFRVVLGIDRNFSRFWSNTELYVLAQYAIDKFTGKGEEFVKKNGVNFNHLFRQAVTLNFDMKVSETYSLHIKGILDLEKGGRLVQSEFRWKPRDSVVAYIGADYLDGRDETYFGLFRNNDRFLAGVRLDL